jgi:hypothetical protein
MSIAIYSTIRRIINSIEGDTEIAEQRRVSQACSDVRDSQVARKVTSRAGGHLSLLRAEYDLERCLDANISFEGREGLRYCRLSHHQIMDSLTTQCGDHKSISPRIHSYPLTPYCNSHDRLMSYLPCYSRRVRVHNQV